MSKRKLNVLLSMMALLLGLFIYVVFREKTHVAKFFEHWEIVVYMRNMFTLNGTPFTKYYLPDFLWAFALCCILQAIYIPKLQGTLFCGLTSMLCGCIWEGMQYLGYIGGTGDVLDMLMYFLSSFVSIIINLKEREQ